MPAVPPGESLDLVRLTDAEFELSYDATDDDLALANEILNLEKEQREREFTALERLLVYVPGGDGPLDERLIGLILPEFAAAAHELFELGWIDR